jgi:hypothetical protein
MILLRRITDSADFTSPVIGRCILSVTSHIWHIHCYYNERTPFSFYRLLSVVCKIIGRTNIYVYPYMFISPYTYMFILAYPPPGSHVTGRAGDGYIKAKLQPCNRESAII